MSRSAEIIKKIVTQVEKEVAIEHIICDACNNIFLEIQEPRNGSDDTRIYTVKNGSKSDTFKKWSKFAAVNWASLKVQKKGLFDLCPDCADDIIDKFGLINE